MSLQITMTVDGAPNPFEKTEGRVDYHVSNVDSVPLTPFTGATIEPRADAPASGRADRKALARASTPPFVR
jgi:hypothetical protein